MEKEKLEKINKSKTFNRIIKTFDLNNKKVLDVGCGEGNFLHCFGNGSLGITTTQSEANYGIENNLNIILGNAEKIDSLNIEKDFDILWANNLIEHLLSPHSFLMKLKEVSEKNTTLILGVPVIPKIQSLLKINKFRGALASNHINFFTKKSLEFTVERAGWKIKDIKSFVFGVNFIDKIFTFFFSPHIYIIAENISDFKYPEKKIKEWQDDAYYKNLIGITKCD